MITLYGFGPAFGLTDPSPFVAKTETLLKMANLPYRCARAQFSKAPKGKIPYIEDDGQRIGDSTFIRWHIERKYGVDFDRTLSAGERSISWAFEKMTEDHLYWAAVDARWMDDENFRRGPSHFFTFIPAPLRPLAFTLIRRKVRRSLHAHGMGRHSTAEIAELGARSLAALSEHLADKPFFMGPEPTAIDATLFGFVSGILCPHFRGPLQAEAARHANFAPYLARLIARYYPDVGDVAGVKAVT